MQQVEECDEDKLCCFDLLHPMDNEQFGWSDTIEATAEQCNDLITELNASGLTTTNASTNDNHGTNKEIWELTSLTTFLTFTQRVKFQNAPCL